MIQDLPKILTSQDTVIEASVEHKPIQALSLDPSGARMVTGGIDGVLRYWDFAGMNCVNPRPFREFIPVEAHAINALSFSEVGTLVLCVTSDSRARIFDREGSVRPIEETIKGDQYIRTPENTKGHTQMLSYGEFHPKENHRFLTASYDSTVRLWDLNTKRMGMDQNIPNVNCFKCVDARGICGGNRMYASTAVYSSEGGEILAGCSDGSLHLFNDKSKYGKGLSIVRSAHQGEVTGISFTKTNDVLTRGMDDCVKYWDLRKFKDPLRTWSGVETARSFSNLAISPDGRYVVAGTGSGEVSVINLETGELHVDRKKLASKQLICTKWHPDLNQVISTGLDGNVYICFDSEDSRKGALSFINKQPGSAATSVSSGLHNSTREVFSYEELIESGRYRENRQGQLKEVVASSSVRPKFTAQPAVDATAQALSNRRRKDHNDEEDDIQKYLLSSTASTGLVSSAYRESQPELVLDYSTEQGQVDHLLKNIRKEYCPQCGLKICTCGFMTGSSAEPRHEEGPSVTSTKRSRYYLPGR